jgi:hypothetical protein
LKSVPPARSQLPRPHHLRGQPRLQSRAG